MLFKNITIIDENLEVKENMYVGTEGDRIGYVGEKEPEKDYGSTVDGKDRCLMSGFVNAHGHSPMTLMRGYGEDMTLQDWLFGKIFPYEDHLDSEGIYSATMLAVAESLKNGIVSTSDMYFFCDDMVRAYIESGAKGNICRSISIMGDEPLLSAAPARESKELFEEYDGAADGRIIIDLCLHAEYTNSESTARQLADLAKELGAGMQVHVSETKKETEECIMRHGVSPTVFLNNAGLFDTRTTAAHCVWLDDEDFQILKEKNVSIAVNPVSNLKLASGVANVPKMMEMGINVCIGTDSVASNNSLDFIEEMKMFAIAPKMQYGDPSKMRVRQVLAAATRGGALSQGREDCGMLKEGMKADLIMLDTSGCHMHPLHSLENNIIYSAGGSDIVMTMVDGEVLYKDGEFTTIDIEKAIYGTEKGNERILSKL